MIGKTTVANIWAPISTWLNEIKGIINNSIRTSFFILFVFETKDKKNPPKIN